ncbi:MAG TPA: amidohydrolase family protein [Armatimonadota bacterium]|nr:amidohydrolase family protein [Armatimonadota bacterium]
MSRMTPLVEAFLAQGKLAACPIYDLHTHPDRFAGIYFPAPDVDGILRTMDRCGVAKIAIAPHAALLAPVEGNDLTFAMLAAHPDRFLGYLVFNPHYPETLDALLARSLETPGIVGFKIHPAMHDYPLTGAAYQPLFAWANTHRQLVLAHTWADPRCDAVACRTIAEQYPAMLFLLGHSCWGDFPRAIALAAALPNVYLELTAAEHVPGFIEQAVRGAGAEKLIFGSDLPWFNPHYTLGCVLFADIEDADRHAILHGNAERILEVL